MQHIPSTLKISTSTKLFKISCKFIENQKRLINEMEKSAEKFNPKVKKVIVFGMSLQKQIKVRVVLDFFTNGTSAQRMYWLKKGFDTGYLNQEDTFNVTSF